MWLFVLAVVIGLVAGRLRGGSPSLLADLRIHSIAYLVAGTVLAIRPSFFPFSEGLGHWLSFALLGLFAMRNMHLVGMPIFLIGLSMNFLPVAVNGGMPVRASALVGAGLATPESVEQLELGDRRHLADGDSLMPLADIVPIPALHSVVSFGDLIMAAGLVNVVAAGSLPRRRRRQRATPADDPAFAAAARAAVAAEPTPPSTTPVAAAGPSTTPVAAAGPSTVPGDEGDDTGSPDTDPRHWSSPARRAAARLAPADAQAEEPDDGFGPVTASDDGMRGPGAGRTLRSAIVLGDHEDLPAASGH